MNMGGAPKNGEPLFGMRMQFLRVPHLLLSGFMVLTAYAQPDLDSLRAVALDTRQADTVRAKAMESMVARFIYGDQDSALLWSERLRAVAETCGSAYWLCRAWTGLGIIPFQQQRYAEARHAFERALNAAQRAGNEREASNAMMNLANVYNETGRAQRAIELCELAAALSKHVGDARVLSCTLLNLSTVHAELGDYVKSNQYLDQALAAGSAREMIPVLYQMRADNLAHMKRFTEADAQFRLALDSAHALGASAQYSDFEKHWADALLAMEHYDSARTHIQQALFWARRNAQPGMEEQAHVVLANIELKCGHWSKARKELRTSSALLSGNEYGSEARDLYRAYIELYKATGNATEALRYTDLLQRTEDSLKMNETRRSMQGLELRDQERKDSLRSAEQLAAEQQEHAHVLGSERARKHIFLYAGLGIAAVALALWWSLGRTRRAKKRSEEILYNVLPEEVAHEIRETGTTRSKEIEQVTILFTDFKGFTELSARIPQQELMSEIDACFRVFDEISQRHGVEKIKTIGDAYMAAAGLKGDARTAAEQAVRAALGMQLFIEKRHAERSAKGLPAFRMRVGIHTGPVVAGIVGVKKFQYDIWGDTVNTASRMESSGEVGQVNISEATYELVKDAVASAQVPVVRLPENGQPTTTDDHAATKPAFGFTPRGKVEAKGKGRMEMYFVHAADGSAEAGQDP